MARKARRATFAPRLDALEGRTLLSLTAATLPAATAASVLVRFSTATPAAVSAADLAVVGGRVVTTYPDGPSVVALPRRVDPAAALAELRAAPGVAYAEAGGAVRAAGVIVPNDPKYPQEYGLPMIDAPQAWSVSTGSPATIVAVLDTGLDLKDPDFSAKLWTNPDSSGSDGYRGDVHGWNFVNNTPNVQDNNGHGTHVTGILAATGNNAYGVAGVDWNSQIMVLKVLDAQGNGSTDRAVAAIYFAVAHGARVINASWGGDVFSQAMLDALNYANSRGVVFVTAAGNESADNDVTPTYPASFRTPNELVVAAVDQFARPASFSNVGPATVDVAAPGVDILSAVPGGYQAFSGTSMSTPFVTGTVSLLVGLHPNFTAAQLVDQVRSTAKPFASLNGLLISPGVVDPYFALINHRTSPAAAAPAAGGGTVTAAYGPKLVAGETSLEDVETILLSSDAVYAADGGTADGFVKQAYVSLFGRTPNPDEAAYYDAALGSGLTRATLVHALQNSAEGLRTRVARWYTDALGSDRTVADLKGDPSVIYYAGLLPGHSDADVQTALFTGGAIYNAYGGTPEGYAVGLFRAVLGRDSESEGVAYYAAELRAGASRYDVFRQFFTSNEGRRTTIARLYRNGLGAALGVDALKVNDGVGIWAGYLGGD